MKILPLLLLALVSGCTTTSPLPAKLRSAKNFNQIRNRVFQMRPSLETFESLGPLAAIKTSNFKINLSSNKTILTDFYRPSHRGKAPLLIFSHGNKSFKEAHANQAATAATWGFYSLVLQLPNRNQWVENGSTIYELVKLVTAWPKTLSQHIDTDKIILVGHSFGGSAISIAAGKGARVSGLIYLDPAVVADSVPNYVRQIEAPAVLLGADPRVFQSKRRQEFFKNKRGNMLEVTFQGATHDDAQFPSRFELQAFGFDPFTSEENQKRFTAAIIASAFSFANFGNTDFALQIFKPEVQRGVIENPKIKR